MEKQPAYDPTNVQAPPPGYSFSGLTYGSKEEEAGFASPLPDKDGPAGQGSSSHASEYPYSATYRAKAAEAGHPIPPAQSKNPFRDIAGPGGSASKPIKKDERAPEYTESDAVALWPNMPPPPAQRGQRLPLPVAVPQLTGNYDSMFVRAYCPELKAAGVGVQEWMDFLDGLNLAIVASPPLRIVDKVGLIIGFVPNEWAQIAGPVIQFVAQTGMAMLSARLTDRFLRRANRDYFEPRGLRVRLCRSAAMRALIGKEDPQQLQHRAIRIAKSLGRQTENFVLSNPIVPGTGKFFELIHTPLAPVDAHTELDVTQRRIEDLKGFVCHLDVDGVPPAKTPQDLIGKMNELAVKMDRNMALNEEARASRTRRMLEIRKGLELAPSSTPGGKFSPSPSTTTLVHPGYVSPPMGMHTGYASAPPAMYGQYPSPPPGAYGGQMVASPQPYGPQGYAPPPPGTHGYPYHSAKSQKKAIKESLKSEKKARKAGLKEQRRGMPFSIFGVTPERREVKDEEKFVKAELKARKDVMKGRKPNAWYLQDEVRRVDRLEYNMTLELVWVVVLNADQDEAIKNKEKVDNAEDVEYVDEEEVEAVVEREEEEDEAVALGDHLDEDDGDEQLHAPQPVAAMPAKSS